MEFTIQKCDADVGDARIATINEDINGIHAIDLVMCKLLQGALSDSISEMLA